MQISAKQVYFKLRLIRQKKTIIKRTLKNTREKREK